MFLRLHCFTSLRLRRLGSGAMTRFALVGFFFVLAALGASQIAGQTPPAQHVFVSTKAPTQPNPTQLSVLTKDPSTGALTIVTGSPFNERLSGSIIAIDALGRYLFAMNAPTNNISMFSIDAMTGALTEVPNSPFATPPYLNPVQAPTVPVAMTVEKTGKYLYVAFQSGSNTGFSAINSFEIDSVHQALVPTAQKGLDIVVFPIALASDPLGKNIYVASQRAADNTTVQGGYQVFQIDSATGALTLIQSGNTSETGRCMAMDPQGRFMYFGAGFLLGRLFSFTISPFDGTLSGTGSVDIGTAPLNQNDLPLSMSIDSTGHFLYMNSVREEHLYSIDQTTGVLTELSIPAGSPTGVEAVDPLGPYMYGAGGGTVSGYEVDPSTGLFSQIAGSPFAIPGTGNAYDAKISGVAAPPPPAPLAQFDATQMLFGPATIGFPIGPQSVHLVNNGTAPLVISLSPKLINITGANPGAFSESDDCMASLAAGAHCTINVTFAPTLVQAYSAMISVTDNATGSPQTLPLGGSGVAPVPGVTYSPSSLSYTSIPADTSSAAQTITVTSVGNAPLSVTSVSLGGSNPGDFTLMNNCTAPVAVNSTCSIAVTFMPKAVGARSAQLLIADNAPGNSISIGLSGVATDPFGIGTGTGGSTSATVAPGGMAQFNLQLTPAAGFAGTVSFQCSGAPTASTCTVNPPSAQATGNPIPLTVIVATTGKTQVVPVQNVRPRAPGIRERILLIAFASLLASLMALAKLGKRRPAFATRRIWFARIGWVAAPALIVLALALSGCGGGSMTNPPPPVTTPPGTFMLSVTATSGTVTEQIQLSLTVTP